MADIINTGPTTLADYAALVQDSDVSRKFLIQTIRDYSGLFDQMCLLPGNDGTGCKGQIITDYPEAESVGFNEGWGSGHVSGRAVRYDSTRCRISSDVDCDLYHTRPPAERANYRLRKDKAFMRGLARQVAKKVFHGDRKSGMLGLYDIVNGKANTEFSEQVLRGSSTSTTANCFDIWLINSDEEGCFFFFPEHGSDEEGKQKDKSTAGVWIEPIPGKQRIEKNGKHYYAYVTEMGFDIGVAIFDPRRVVRIANIDSTTLTTSGTTGDNLVSLMTTASDMLEDINPGKCAFFCNDTVHTMLRQQINERVKNSLTFETVAGRKVITFDGIPVHKMGRDVLPMSKKI